MLSEQVLEQFVRRTDLQETLVRSAWPSITTESRLQLIDAILQVSIYLPDWLLDLAQSDSAEIVRYWASRKAVFRKTIPAFCNDDGIERSAEPAELARCSRAEGDPSELVRMAASTLSTFDSSAFTAASQRQRLVALRDGRPILGSFVSWLDEAIDAGVADQELAACAIEFFEGPACQEWMKRDRLPSDGMTAASESSDLRSAWSLVRLKAGPALAFAMAHSLAVKRGLFHLKANELAQMPPEVIGCVWYRRRGDAAVLCGELMDLVRTNPSTLSQDVLEALDKSGEVFSDDERLTFNAMKRPFRQAATIDLLVSLRDEIRAERTPADSPRRLWPFGR